MNQSVLLKANGNLYTAEVSPEGHCTLNTGEEFLLSATQLEKFNELLALSARTQELAQLGRPILPITDQEQLPEPEIVPIHEPEAENEETPKRGRKAKKEKKAKPDAEALGIEDLEAYEHNLAAVRKKREERAKLVSIIAAIILLLSVGFLWLLNTGVFDSLLHQQEEVAIEEVVEDEGQE